MTDLGCNVTCCCHNEEQRCCLNSIEVKGDTACKCDDTCCGSFYEDKSGAKNATESPNVNLSIICQATNCIYNHSEKCNAEHVDISGIRATTSDETVCATFRSKE
ncbi:MAG: DUF1540 domain-containing protein [Lachnospira sp.]|nr:DUF1540 domain-containing protein [Lachnospira sp.]